MAEDLGADPRITRDRDFDYPWIDWLNGHLWELRPGRDFEDPIATFRQRCYRAIKRIGLPGDTVRTKYLRNKGIFQLQAWTTDDLGRPVPISYDPPVSSAPPPPSEPPAQPGAWTPAPPRPPR